MPRVAARFISQGLPRSIGDVAASSIGQRKRPPLDGLYPALTNWRIPIRTNKRKITSTMMIPILSVLKPFDFFASCSSTEFNRSLSAWISSSCLMPTSLQAFCNLSYVFNIQQRYPLSMQNGYEMRTCSVPVAAGYRWLLKWQNTGSSVHLKISSDH